MDELVQEIRKIEYWVRLGVAKPEEVYRLQNLRSLRNHRSGACNSETFSGEKWGAWAPTTLEEQQRIDDFIAGMPVPEEGPVNLPYYLRDPVKCAAAASSVSLPWRVETPPAVPLPVRPPPIAATSTGDTFDLFADF